MSRYRQTMAGWILGVLLALGAVGCGTSSTSDGLPAGMSASEYLLNTEPPGAREVHDVRTALEAIAKPDSVVLVGRIGGADDQTWDPKQAAFAVTDTATAAQTAGEEHPGHDADNCPFCRAKQQKLAASLALVQVVGRDGQVLPVDARKLLGLKKGQTIVVCGQGEIDSLGMLVVKARSIYVRK